MAKKVEKNDEVNKNSKEIFKFDNEFENLVNSVPGIIWMDTLEEEKFITELMDDIRTVKDSPQGKKSEPINKDIDISVWMWSFTSGLFEITNSIDPLLENIVKDETRLPEAALNEIISHNENELGIYIMRGLGNLISMQPQIPRKLKDIYKILYTQHKIIIITATDSNIPLALDKNITHYKYNPMSREKITNLLEKKFDSLKSNEMAKRKNIKIDYNKSDVNDITNACLGLSDNEIRRNLNFFFNKRDQIYISEIIKEKKRAIEKSGVLEYWNKTESLDNVGGLNELKKWLKKRKNCLSEDARKFGLPIPRGILIVGVPGCGKSLCAKAVASEFGLPLIRMDVGKLMQGLVGASESNTRKALDVASGNAPCIMWIDEIEKNLSGSASSNMSDSGTLNRVFGTFTTWLQEKETYVFVIATANDISQLPPELTRKGRLDEIWYVGLPTESERKEIFNIQIKKYGRNPKNFNIDALAKIKQKVSGKVYDYTGAEIEESIRESLHTAFDRDIKSDITTEDIIESLSLITPISKSEEERINKIVSHGEKHYRLASCNLNETKIIKKDMINLD